MRLLDTDYIQITNRPHISNQTESLFDKEERHYAQRRRTVDERKLK